jgi:hypothetical protein
MNFSDEEKVELFRALNRERMRRYRDRTRKRSYKPRACLNDLRVEAKKLRAEKKQLKIDLANVLECAEYLMSNRGELKK